MELRSQYHKTVSKNRETEQHQDQCIWLQRKTTIPDSYFQRQIRRPNESPISHRGGKEALRSNKEL